MKLGKGGPHIDWASGRRRSLSAAWFWKGLPVRLSGQDSGRGTFSQRHAEYHDAETGRV